MRLRRALLPVAALLPAPACAGGLSATASGEAQAEVVVPLTVAAEQDLDFGSIFATTAPGTVTINGGAAAAYAGGARSACGGGACADPHAARFVVTGEAGRSYAIAVPGTIKANGTATDGSGAAPTLTVSGLSVRSASRPDAGAAGQLDAGGSDRFEVGGTLEVPASLPPAHYRATVPVVVNYI